jgi:hypothetical protein
VKLKNQRLFGLFHARVEQQICAGYETYPGQICRSIGMKKGEMMYDCQDEIAGTNNPVDAEKLTGDF